MLNPILDTPPLESLPDLPLSRTIDFLSSSFLPRIFFDILISYSHSQDAKYRLSLSSDHSASVFQRPGEFLSFHRLK